MLQQLIDDPAYDKKEDAQNRMNTCLAEVSEISVETNPAGALITIDGTAQATPAPVVIHLLPGDHEVAFSADGYEAQTRSLTAAKGEKTTLYVDLAVPPPAPAQPELLDPFEDDAQPATGPEANPAAAPADAIGPPPAFWVMAAITGVGVVSGTVFGTMALRDENDYEETGSDATKESGERSAIIADVSFGVAIAAAVSGAIILIVHHSKKDTKGKAGSADNGRLQFSPVAGGSTVGFQSAVSF